MRRRETELDILRFLALLCVISLHVNSSVWSEMEVLTSDWLAATLLRFTWAVPVFVMISGRFLLDPERTVNYGKYVGKIASAFAFWSLAYQIYYLTQRWPLADGKGFFAGLLTGAYHMWYLWMLLGLYAVTPLLRKIAPDRKLTGYFLLLHTGVQSLAYFVRELPLVGNTTGAVLDKLQLHFVMGYTGYYLLGFHLHRWEPTKKQEFALYGAGLLSAALSTGGNLLIAAKTGVNSEFFTSYQAPTMMLQAAAVYTLFAKGLSNVRWKPGTGKLFAAAADYGFGMYLAHALVNELAVALVGKPRLAEHPLLLIPAVTVLVAAGSFALTAVLKKLPLLSKFVG